MVTAQYLQFAQAEDTGSMEDAVKRVIRLRNCARSLIEAIDASPITDVVRDYADDTLGLSYAILNSDKLRKALRICTVNLASHKYIPEIYAVLERFVNACNLALKQFDDVSQNDYWPSGRAWEHWIRQLTDILKAHHLPTGVSKDTRSKATRSNAMRSKAPRFKAANCKTASSFVEFIYTLQTLLPKKYVRGQHSRGALALAIYRARAKPKPPLPARKGRARKRGSQ
jgi:hypothetical protein